MVTTTFITSKVHSCCCNQWYMLQPVIHTILVRRYEIVTSCTEVLLVCLSNKTKSNKWYRCYLQFLKWGIDTILAFCCLPACFTTYSSSKIWVKNYFLRRNLKHVGRMILQRAIAVYQSFLHSWSSFLWNTILLSIHANTEQKCRE